MIKSFEAVIAIMILLLFVFILFSNYNYNDYRENIVENKTYEIINLKAENEDFRRLIFENDSEKVYNVLYNHIDMSFNVKICDFTGSSCESFGSEVPTNTSIYAVNYYFFKNKKKTLNVLIWSR